MKTFFAHTAPEHDPDGSWQSLPEHLNQVAELAGHFATEARPGDEDFKRSAELCAYLHDLGKFRDDFQRYLSGEIPKSKKTRHAIYGAKAAATCLKSLHALFVILGHHAGLPDSGLIKAKLDEIDNTELDDLLEVLSKHSQVFSEFKQEFLRNSKCPPNTDLTIRMLFSCLVDADWLDTASHMQELKLEERALNHDLCIDSLDRYIGSFSDAPRNTLSELRQSIYHSACSAGSNPQGFFSMTVPTGGGKTLSSMAFALQHAKTHTLKRIIVVIPFLSIIEQNADVYRNVFGDDCIIEHHSAIEPPSADDESGRFAEHRLLSENWNAPIVITTSVQFIESLFASKPSRCRKLHNIARSVVIFDECQTLPTHLLEPTLNIFREMVKEYGTSILLCTATQPGFSADSIKNGLRAEEITEVAPNPCELFARLQRVKYEFPASDKPTSWSELASTLVRESQALIVVNTKKQTFECFEELKNQLPNEEHDSLFHLSSSMAAQHRFDALGDSANPAPDSIRGRLRDGRPCRVVSTQLIEAGVDVDFPLVYRAIGPLDSIVQAGGRCNREGKLENKGRVVVFKPDSDPVAPRGTYRIATDVSARFLDETGLARLASDPDIFNIYFNHLFPLLKLDVIKPGEDTIQAAREKLNFEYVDRNAYVIPKNTQSVLVPYRDGARIIRAIRSKSHVTQNDIRRLQRYSVSLHERDFSELEALGGIEPLLPHIQIPTLDRGFYHPTFGVLIERRPLEEFVI